MCFPYSSDLALILGVVQLSCIGHTTISGHIFQGRKFGQFWVLQGIFLLLEIALLL